MNILINSELEIPHCNFKNIEKDTRKMLRVLKLNNSELSILFVDYDKIQELNKQYRKKDKITDVLSFPQNEGILSNLNIDILGDVVICYPQAVKQAPEFENTVYEEIIVLIIHSILHLIGYDHITPREDIVMRKKETDIFMELFN